MDIKSLILKKQEGRSGKHLAFKDVNRPLIIALLAIPVYRLHCRTGRPWLTWAGLMNTCKAQAEETILTELVYD